MFRILLILILLQSVACIQPKSSGSEAAIGLLFLPNQTSSQNSISGSCTTTQVGSEFETIVQAVSQNTWTNCSLSLGGKLVSETDLWDIRFQRFKIGTNSGTSGTGSSGSCYANTDSAELVNISSCTLKLDQILNQEGGGSNGSGSVTWSGAPDFFDWYAYNNTVLTAKSKQYLVRSADGKRHFRIKMLDYYNTAGTSGYPKFRWKEL